MKILHILPGDTYTDKMTYKDNYLAKINVEQGHEAIILTSCRTWAKTKVIYTEEMDYYDENGVRIIRKKYKFSHFPFISKKLRILRHIKLLLEDLKPDVIRVLNPHNLTILSVGKYVKKNPNVKFYIDSHQEYYNSATNFISYYVFHRVIIKNTLKLVNKYVDKYFYVLEGTKEFIKNMYNLPENKLEYFPMGGIVLSTLEKDRIRNEIRKELNIPNEAIVYIHTGKLFKSKKTKEIIQAFNNCNDENAYLIIIGSIPQESENDLVRLLSSSERVHFLGWKTSSNLYQYLCSSDIYLQPGSASATLFQALTSGCVLLVSRNIRGYEKLNENNNLLYADEYHELFNIFTLIKDKKISIEELREKTLKIANRDYNYETLARKLYR